ncbi:hypothetical protein HDG34_000330 [Paraburkholderia sp. HC6.4b]|uniref:alpha/beta hydrolase n=1 Tax=unclassified Paraburkholderia TaxID=2615204 RepID=UPI0016172448|nr:MULTISPECIES: alpha/beta hydrolase [unclassified Paraburkholderia]MBB5406415.1 hypothetical protein [Paraburkholderia sp. HC6.4b]MBB5448813.1 hypothetical protein [Paraburkholderia sp. Kb1A]
MRHDVKFPSSGLSIAGHLYVPENASGPLPGIVIGHPMGSVKEQSPSNYAERLVKQGFVILTFDAAYQGDSEGSPRGLEDPIQRAEDVKSAVSYLSIRPEVDPQRIGALGICASGGYVPFAAQTDHRIKAVATVVGACVGILWREGMDGKQSPDVLQKQLDEAAVDRTNEAKGEPVRMAQIVPATDEQAKFFPEKSMFREAYDYYRTPRGQHPHSTNQWVARSVDKIAQYDSYALVDLIAPRPLLMIAGTEADTQRFSVETIEKAKGPKELFWIEGASHVDLYDKPEYVDPASVKLVSFFKQHLG